MSGHDPVGWAVALEEVATVFVGNRWHDEAWELMATAAELRLKVGER